MSGAREGVGGMGVGNAPRPMGDFEEMIDFLMDALRADSTNVSNNTGPNPNPSPGQATMPAAAAAGVVVGDIRPPSSAIHYGRGTGDPHPGIPHAGQFSQHSSPSIPVVDLQQHQPTARARSASPPYSSQLPMYVGVVVCACLFACFSLSLSGAANPLCGSAS